MMRQISRISQRMGHKIAGLEHSIDVSDIIDDDEAVAGIVGQLVIQDMHTDVVVGEDDSVEAALGL